MNVIVFPVAAFSHFSILTASVPNAFLTDFNAFMGFSSLQF